MKFIINFSGLRSGNWFIKKRGENWLCEPLATCEKQGAKSFLATGEINLNYCNDLVHSLIIRFLVPFWKGFPHKPHFIFSALLGEAMSMITADLKEVLNVEPKILIHSAPFVLENGSILPELKIEYRAFGRLNEAGDNVLWVCHALTASAEVQSWWPGFVGPGFIYDPDRYFIICANILGSCYGTSGPIEINKTTSTPYYSAFPQVTIRDMVKAHEILREHLGIKSIHTCVGGSLGGQQAVEWAIMQPSLIKHLVLLATNAYHSPWGIAFNEAQRMAVMADPTYKDDDLEAGQDGLRAARAIALLSYRSYETYNATQKEEDINKTDHYKASSYQQYQGDKLVRRFHAHSYWVLSKAMDSHHVGRGRGSVEAALATIKSHTMVIAISSDLLFPPCEQQLLAKNIPGAQYQEIESLYGHDGFLIEAEKISAILNNFYQD